MTADEEDKFIVAQANEPLDEDGSFVRRKVMARYRDEFHEIDRFKSAASWTFRRRWSFRLQQQ